jgi:hypothetical protein
VPAPPRLRLQHHALDHRVLETQHRLHYRGNPHAASFTLGNPSAEIPTPTRRALFHTPNPSHPQRATHTNIRRAVYTRISDDRESEELGVTRPL